MDKFIKDKSFSGERPLYNTEDLTLEGVTFLEGESALKECRRIEASGCRFEGRYPFWCCSDVLVSGSEFTSESRAPLWYSRNVRMQDCIMHGPKALREIDGALVRSCRFPEAVETLWKCRGVDVEDSEFAGADYFAFGSLGLRLRGVRLQGKYTFQYCRNVEIRNCILDTKDAFWESENVTVYDSIVKGEYLGWYSRGLKLVRCEISLTQPLCYATDLVLEDCTMAPSADLAFEYSSVEATVNGRITSVKNPLTGHIRATAGYGEIILDENLKSPGNCIIE